MMSIKSQQIWRKIGAGLLIVLLLLFLTDYFRVKSSYVATAANLEYNNVVSPSITIEVTKAFLHPGIDKEYYFQVLNTLFASQQDSYLLGKDIYLEANKSDTELLQKGSQFAVSGKIVSNNYGMLKMIVEKVSSDY